MLVDATLHSYSLRYRFAHKKEFDAFAFASLAVSTGFTGISLSLNDANYRHLGGRDPSLVEAFGRHRAALGLSLEIDTSGTHPAHLSELLHVAHRMGARSLRTYTRHRGSIEDMIRQTISDLSQVMPVAKELGIVVVLENHEDFTGRELAQIVEAVGHPNLKILYDYGNSQMVLEDPEVALEAVLPHVYSVHVKDQVLIRNERSDHAIVVGVSVGEGFLPLERITRRLLESGLRTFCFENVWSYSSPIQSERAPSAGVVLGTGAFSYLDPPFDPSRVNFTPQLVDPEQLVSLEFSALTRGIDEFRNILGRLGCKGILQSLSNT